MALIKDKIDAISIISNKFGTYRDEFIETQDVIVSTLRTLLSKHDQKFSLTRENSVRKLKFYTLVSRVKEINSFSEKLIRNNDYNLFTDIKLDDPQNNDLLKENIKQIEDLIGIKILTDLNIDTANIFKLISSTTFLNEASAVEIEFNKDDIAIQPVEMKNGLLIYKIRCKYKSWNFELQIKSKLDSAWGDMEHSFFYKDYKITPVRDLAQQSMNHIGQLLLQIDKFLHEIRDANINFRANSETILFINEFEEKYSEKIAPILGGISYNFKKIGSLCYHINKNIDLLKVDALNTEYLSLRCEKYENYIIARNKNFDLQILELITLSTSTEKITQENVEEKLNDFFKSLISSYTSIILNHGFEEDLAIKYSEFIIDIFTQYQCIEYILNTNKICTFIKDHLKPLEDMIDDFAKEDRKIRLSIYTIFYFHQNLNLFLEKQNLEREDLLKNLDTVTIECKKLSPLPEHIISNLNQIVTTLNN